MRLCGIVACALLSRSTVVAVSDAATVDLTDGTIRGEQAATYRAFRGIPYARPPLRELRFAPPVPPPAWKPTVLDATAYKHNCLQDLGQVFDPPMPKGTLSEDCLYLNVFTPAKATAADSLPVMVWIHGGGYQGGGANESRLNGVFDAALDDMIVVTINYRLNIFGFLAGDALRITDKNNGGTGNYGILDQRLALQWVQANVRAFGGDPTRVLLSGESAGGASVINHLARPNSRGLFHAAVQESGGYTFIQGQADAASFNKVFATVAKAAGCDKPTPAQTVACLQSADAAAIQKAKPAADVLTFSPVVDGVDLPDTLTNLIARGGIAPVPVISGCTREDLGFVPLAVPPCAGECTQAHLTTTAREIRLTNYPNINVSELVELYSDEVPPTGGDKNKWYWAAKHMSSDATMVCPARWIAMNTPRRAGGGSNAWVYMFAHAPAAPASGAYPSLAHHASEIPFVFHVLDARGPDAKNMRIYGDAEIALSAAMVRYWRNLGASGDPNVDPAPRGARGGAGLGGGVEWAAYSRDTDTWMMFGDLVTSDTTVAARAGLRTQRCDFWDRVQHPQQ